MDQLKCRTGRLLLSQTKLELIFFLILLSLAAMGFDAAPSPNANVVVEVLPPPARSFPPVKPGMIRLPVDIIFPPGGDAFHHIADLVKGGIKQVAQETVLKSRMRALWAKMESPIRMDKDLWLLVRPESLSVGKMRTDLKQASTLHAVLELVASPEIRFGPEPLTTPVEMPPLRPFQPGPGTFQAMTNTHINYEDANRYFRDPRMKLIGKVLPGSGERKLTITGLRIYGSGGKVIVEVKLHYNPPIINFTGKPAKLTVYFKGTPRYRPKERMFDMPDLDYDIKSNDLVVQVADFVFKDDFKKQFRGIAKLPIGPKIDIMQQKMEKALNRTFSRFVRIRTQVRSLRVLGGLANNEGIVARLSVRGTATMEVTWN